MSEELQSLLNKIRHDGVDKAKAEADGIVAEAKAQAAFIVKTAQTEAEKFRAEAKRDADAFAARSQETLQQAARDVSLSIEQAVTGVLNKVLAQNVNVALSNSSAAAGLVIEAIKAYASGKKAEVAAGRELADMLRVQLAQQSEITVVTNETLGTGFKIRLSGGRIEHDFTGPAVTEALARLLRPQLAALLK